MSEKLKIVYRPLQELSPYAHNARTHSPEQVAQLVESIKQFGWTNPVLIDEKGEIIAGHGRVMAAEMLKMDSVPVIVLSGLTDEQKKAYRLADNRLPMNAGWDEDLLRMELSDLINADFDVSLTGFIPTEIDELLTDVLPGTGNEEEPYTTKIDTPVYEPSGGKPDISELYDDTKTQELISRIRSASLEPDIEKFLLCAAERHTVFNFSRIADYYAHAPSEIQCFFEESALVIIDYQQAIENGFVRMTQRMVEIMHGGEEEEYGGLGFVDNAIPNPDCPKCCGEGTGQLYMADTTLLDGDARQLYAGAKFGKFGVEILLEDKAAARRELLRLFSAGGALCADKRLQELEIERRRMENQKLRKEIETVEDNEHPQPVAININVVDARVRSDEDDLSDA